MSFDNYANLWVDDRQEFLRQFLTYGHILTQEEIEAHAAEGVPESPPELEQFKEEIDSYEDIYQQVSKLNDIEKFDSWFKISIRPNVVNQCLKTRLFGSELKYTIKISSGRAAPT